MMVTLFGFKNCLLLCIVIIVGSLFVDAFPLLGGGERSYYGTIQQQQQKWRHNNKLMYSSNDNNIYSSTDTSCWSLEHDWALLDLVPKFTVGDDHRQIRTFWTQLAASTPVFATIQDPEVELYQRCKKLSSNKEKKNTKEEEGEYDNDKLISSLSRSLFKFGPSPPLLQNWHIEKETEMMMGQTEDGHTIWIRYQCLGRLREDPTTTKFTTTTASSGGYIESIGGRIYELGQPHPTSRIQADNDDDALVANDDNDFFSSWFNNNDDERNNYDPVSILSTVSTATFSALFASSILSAFIGYGVGLAIVSGSYSPSGHPGIHATTTTAALVTPTANEMSTIATFVTPTANQMSIHEKRALTEYRVLSEQRSMNVISQQLEKDIMELQDLRLAEEQIIMTKF